MTQRDTSERPKDFAMPRNVEETKNLSVEHLRWYVWHCENVEAQASLSEISRGMLDAWILQVRGILDEKSRLT